MTLILAGAAVLLGNANAHIPPTKEQRKRWEEVINLDRVSGIQQQKLIRQENEKSRSQQGSEAAQLKRQAREAKRANKALPEGVFAPAEEPSAVAPPKEKEKDEAYTIIIPSQPTEHPWFQPPVYETIEAAKLAGVWNYPSTPLEAAKCAVYADLIEKGYFIGGGLKFGGDWLVYPGESAPQSRQPPPKVLTH